MSDQDNTAACVQLWKQVRILKKEKRYKDAIEKAVIVLGMSPEDRMYICETADLYNKTKQSKKAKKLLGPLAETDVVAANIMAKSFMLEKNYPMAAEYYAKNSENDSAASNGLALVYMIQERYEEAETMLRKNIDYDIKNQKYDDYAICTLAKCCQMQGKDAQAEKLYKLVAEKSAFAANKLGHLYMSQAQYDLAEDAYKPHAAKDQEAVSGLTQSYILRGRYMMAEKLISETEKTSHDALTFYMGAMTALKLGDVPKAKQRVMTMAGNCPFTASQATMLKLVTEAGLLEEPLYGFLMNQENLTPEEIVKKPVNKVLEVFNTNLQETYRPVSQPVATQNKL